MGLFGSRTKPNEAKGDRRESPASESNSQNVTQRTTSSSVTAHARSGKASSSRASRQVSQPSQEFRTGADNQTQPTSQAKGEMGMANIGQSIVFKGELTGDEDLEIDGRVEGSVNLINSQLTVAANGQLQAEVNAKSIVVIGRVNGNLTATERIEIQATGVVDGDIKTPRLLVQEGAAMNGRIDMSKAAASTGKPISSSPLGESPTEVRKSA